jgi:hypothetical protein
MKIKTSDLTGPALNWAVAKCEYDNRRYNYGSPCFSPITKRVYETEGLQEIGVNFAPSEEWKQGGPIIEREVITLIACDNDFEAQSRTTPLACEEGPTPLIAAMRCYVASKLGDNVEIPEELL